jgi:glycosyltransferase involved in cell wall biosynthesis
LVAAYLTPPGGASAVGAWTIQALRDEYDITVLTWAEADLATVNRAFGTSLRNADARWLTAPSALQRVVRAMPVPLALLEIAFTMRLIRRQLTRAHYDAVVGVMNELDVGRRVIQYVHYPWARFPRPDADHRWYHVRPALRLYRAVSNMVAGHRPAGAAANLTVANSDWTARLFEEQYGRPCRVVHPPVVGGSPDVPLADRERAFVAIGRLSPEKELEKLFEILHQVRARGHDLRLRIVGPAVRAGYARYLRALAASRGDWIEFHEGLSRSELVRLIARHRYGIHGMTAEHFGIAPAELQMAGCITFVPDDGGPAEIVEGDYRVVYSDVDDAVRKISRMLGDPSYEAQLHADVVTRAGRFSEGRFMREMRATVAEFLDTPASRPGTEADR